MGIKVRRLKLSTKDGQVIIDEEIDVKLVATKDLDPVIELFRVISNESRYRVMRLLAEKPSLTFTELHQALGYSQKTIAQCLDDLLKAEAIAREPEGYQLSPLGKIILAQLREMAAILKKIDRMKDFTLEFG
ncbi:helix-turn-helix domain-containing protein [Candidatus Hecatella orcuttiae]|jgi:predicted transcriptional regulator|uniref:helix-turn-helix domain-containing protein n=1 Tax=Candidatus Hecatella orcuttiae TaxID=1935119 RepID=UPI002867D6FC|nr:helix-turn-helix domain-containing protein [Candidatus Hecatella orcuttiae]